MLTQPLHKGSHSALGDVFPQRNTPEPRLPQIHALEIPFPDTAELKMALELIEIRYQEHLAREDLRALFEAGALCGR
jgi:hypothetical protein